MQGACCKRFLVVCRGLSEGRVRSSRRVFVGTGFDRVFIDGSTWFMSLFV